MTVLIIISMTFYHRTRNILKHIKHKCLNPNLKMAKRLINNHNTHIMKHPVFVFDQNCCHELLLIAQFKYVDQDGHLWSISTSMTTKIDSHTLHRISRHIESTLLHINHWIRQYWVIFHYFFSENFHENRRYPVYLRFFHTLFPKNHGSTSVLVQ